MKFVLSILLTLLSSTLFAQNSLGKKVTINGASAFEGAFIFFPLLNDTVRIDGSTYLLLDTTNPKRKLFYCCFKDEKSKIYNVDSDTLAGVTIDFKIPDYAFFDNLYATKICPLCHKKDDVIPFVYGKPSKQLIKLADMGKVKLAGCSLSDTSPKYYCKADKLEF